MLLSKLKKAKVVIHLHGSYFRTMYEKNNIFGKFLIRQSCRLVSRALVVGECLRYIFEGLVPSKKINVVSVGIEENYITEAELSTKHYALSSNNLCPSVYRVLFLSNLTLSKGFFDVIKSIPIITQLPDDLSREMRSISHRDPMTNVEFIFAGQFWGTEKARQEVHEYIDNHHLKPHIKFTGRVVGNFKKKLLLTSHIFVLPTYYHNEGQPTVILEAIAAGLPIITTDQGCIKEMVIDGENGFIIEKKNPEQIAEKIIYLLKNEKVRREMGKKSRERFLKYYTKDRFIDGLSRVFDEVLAET